MTATEAPNLVSARATSMATTRSRHVLLEPANVRFAPKSGRTSNATAGTKSSAKHNSDQPIIIGRKAPKFLKSLSGNLGISGPERGPNLDAGRCLLADAAASLKISMSDLVE